MKCFDMYFYVCISVLVPVCSWYLGTLSWVNKDEITYKGQNIFPAHRTIYFSQLLRTNFPPAISQFQPAFICSNSATLILD